MTKEAATFWDEQIGHLPIQQPARLSQAALVTEAIEQMQQKGYGCILALNEKEELVGVFTDRDAMQQYIGTSLPDNTSLSDVMTANPYTIDAEESVKGAVEMFHEKKVRHLPVIDKKKGLIGLLSVRVLTDFIAEHLPGDVLNLPPDPTIVSHGTDGG